TMVARPILTSALELTFSLAATGSLPGLDPARMMAVTMKEARLCDLPSISACERLEFGSREVGSSAWGCRSRGYVAMPPGSDLTRVSVRRAGQLRDGIALPIQVFDLRERPCSMIPPGRGADRHSPKVRCHQPRRAGAGGLSAGASSGAGPAVSGAAGSEVSVAGACGSTAEDSVAA